MPRRKGPTKKEGRGETRGAVAPSVEAVDIDYVRIKQISGVVQLSNIVLADVAYTTLGFQQALAAHVKDEAKYDVNVVDARWNRNGSAFDVSLGYSIDTQIVHDGNAVPLFRLRARWVLSYVLPDDFQEPEQAAEAISDFVWANGQVNVFPYLRELVNDVTAKAGWLPLVLPVFRAPARRPRDGVRMMDAWVARALNDSPA